MRDMVLFLALTSLASKENVMEICLMREEHGMNFDLLRNPSGQSLLTWATSQPSTVELETLLLAGLDPNVVDDQGVTPFGLAIRGKEPDKITLLVKYNVDVNLSEELTTMSPLLMACHTLDERILELVYKSGGRFNIESEQERRHMESLLYLWKPNNNFEKLKKVLEKSLKAYPSDG